MQSVQVESHKDICIAVATHKAYRMPEDSMYLPLQVGKALHPDVDLGFACDNTGDNISDRNVLLGAHRPVLAMEELRCRV